MYYCLKELKTIQFWKIKIQSLNTLKNIVLLLILSILTFSYSNFLLDGSLNHPCRLVDELKSPCDSLYVWKISSEPPFKYRILHKTIVKSIYGLIVKHEDNNMLFFRTYQLTAFVFHFLAILTFYYFLCQVNLKQVALAGASVFALLPALSMAYNIPVHTREDTLGYCLLLLGLVAIVQNKSSLIFVYSILGVLCRETILLIAFTNLFFNRNQKIEVRSLIAFTSILVFLFVRFNYGMEPYNHWEGFNWNRDNPVQVVGFSFITFGILWLPFFLQIVKKTRHNGRVQIMVDSAPWVFILVVLTTFFGGIFNEIRLLYILAAWVISIAALYYQENAKKLANYLFAYRTFIFLTVCGMLLFGLFAVRFMQTYLSSVYKIPFSAWATATLIQIALSLIFVPYIYIEMKNRNSKDRVSA